MSQTDGGFAQLARTVGYDFASSRRDPPEVCIRCCPLRDEGAGKPGARCTRGLACELRIKNCTRAYRAAETSGLPCAMALRLTSCSPRRTALLPPSPLRSFRFSELDASTAAPGPHDFTVRVGARTSIAPSASTASHRTFVTIATPLIRRETSGVMRLICVRTKAKYFSIPDLTRFLKIRSDLPVVPVRRRRCTRLRLRAKQINSAETWVSPRSATTQKRGARAPRFVVLSMSYAVSPPPAPACRAGAS